MRIQRWGTLGLMVAGGWLAACGGGTVTIDEPGVEVDDPDDPVDPRVDNGFESDDPTRLNEGVGRGESADGAAGGGSSGGNSSGGAPPGQDGDTGADPGRVIEEADIVKVEGNRLYALSQYGGIAVIDVSNPDQLRLLGRKRFGGIPFEFYLRGSQAYVMLKDFGRYVAVEGNPYGTWVNTSEMLALDVSNPAEIREFAHYDVPGTIADSRLVGDAIYVVTNEDGYCYGCAQQKQGAVVTSFGIGQGGIQKVDQLSFLTATNGYTWQRSVSATNERMYIAGPRYDWNGGSEEANSIIQVVGIHDPQGHMQKGADVPVDGQIMSRWQMDEFDGVLRVVSQHNSWWGGNSAINPSVQTFTVTNASTITPLGETELVLPQPESLRSVRFDGTRGYAITAEQSDPLFTIDLSNPAAPVQAGELHMPGWITHLEPRGDRLIGFGFADTTWSSELAVSLFDVSDLTTPTMLERVEFGSGGGQYAEDADRIHKSVQILDDKGLVLVPFASYGYWDGNSCGQPTSGIQLIDYSHDHLTKRGVAPQYGQSRRALFAGDRLLGMSDRTVSSFDITQRDQPTKTNEIDLANPAYKLARIGNHVASITNDWWTSEVMLSLTPYEGADDAALSGKVSLASLADPSPETCNGYGGWTQWYAARLFPMGDKLVVSVPVYSYASGNYESKMVFGVVDVHDPAAPTLISKTSMPLASQSYGYGYGYGYGGCGGFFDGYGFYSYWGYSLLSDGESMVQVGSKLAYLESEHDPRERQLPNGSYVYDPIMHRRLHVVDFGNPAAPSIAAPLTLGDSRGSFPLLAQGNTVLTSRWRKKNGSSKKVKFYVDRVDLSGAAPTVLPSVNTPGSLLAADAPSGRLVTVDYTRTVTNESEESCYAGGYAPVWYDYDDHRCVKLARSFKLSDVADDVVTLRGTYDPPSQSLGGVKVTDDRIYVTRYPRYDYRNGTTTPDGYSMPTVLEQGGLLVLGGLRSGELGLVGQLDGDAQWPLAAKGNLVALYTQRGLAIYDSTSATPTLRAEQTLRGWGYTSDVILESDRAVCSLGEWGLQTVALTP